MNGYLVEALNNDNELELETVAEVIVVEWIVAGFQGFSGFVDDFGQDNKIKQEVICTISLGGDDEVISNIGDDGKENDGYFASPSVLLYDYNDDNTPKQG